MSDKKNPLIFGEVLFDVFENMREVIGGAPFNVAWHLQGFGLEPVFVSRVGVDERGGHVNELMGKWGMSTKGIQTDTNFPTGKVTVKTKKGEPHFQIQAGMAYDFIDGGLIDESIIQEQYSVLYHGTLALRSGFSRKALHKLKRKSAAGVFFDVNLREPWWKEKLLITELGNAAWVKCNEDELRKIADILQINHSDLDELAFTIVQKFNLEALYITRGKQGAYAIGKNKLKNVIRGIKTPNIVDTVGAGDAFSSVLILGLIKNWTINETINRANDFAAHLCQLQGATIDDPLLYNKFKKKWGLSNEPDK
jgi:fructokinase